jgi:hypothetical protein
VGWRAAERSCGTPLDARCLDLLPWWILEREKLTSDLLAVLDGFFYTYS